MGTYQLIPVRGGLFCVSIGIHEELRVAVDGDEGLDVPVVLHEVHDGLDLHLGIGKLAVVSLRARVAAGSRHCGRRGIAGIPYAQAGWLPHPGIKERTNAFYNLGVLPPSPARRRQR